MISILNFILSISFPSPFRIFTVILFLFLERLLLDTIIFQIATLEHPCMPFKNERDEGAAIWSLPWMKRYLIHSSVQLVELNQVQFGAESLKPGNFLFRHVGFWFINISTESMLTG